MAWDGTAAVCGVEADRATTAPAAVGPVLASVDPVPAAVDPVLASVDRKAHSILGSIAKRKIRWTGGVHSTVTTHRGDDRDDDRAQRLVQPGRCRTSPRSGSP